MAATFYQLFIILAPVALSLEQTVTRGEKYFLMHISVRS